MTATGEGTSRRSFRRPLIDPQGRNMVSWAVATAIGTMNFLRALSGDLSQGWFFWPSMALLGLAATCLALELRQWCKHRNTPSPDECPACGHEWVQHAIGYDVNGVCGGCALDIEYGVPAEVPDGCRLTPPLRSARDAATA